MVRRVQVEELVALALAVLAQRPRRRRGGFSSSHWRRSAGVDAIGGAGGVASVAVRRVAAGLMQPMHIANADGGQAARSRAAVPCYCDGAVVQLAGRATCPTGPPWPGAKAACRRFQLASSTGATNGQPVLIDGQLADTRTLRQRARHGRLMAWCCGSLPWQGGRPPMAVRRSIMVVLLRAAWRRPAGYGMRLRQIPAAV